MLYEINKKAYKVQKEVSSAPLALDRVKFCAFFSVLHYLKCTELCKFSYQTVLVMDSVFFGAELLHL